MPPLKDFTGATIGCLKVIERVGTSKAGHPVWAVVCDRGCERELTSSHLAKPAPGCRCRREDLCGTYTLRHGHSSIKSTPTYGTWSSMKQRCNGTSPKCRAAYFDKGITYCDRWEIFDNFLADMGERPPGTSLDRIDSKRGYEPGNCRWADALTQSRNREYCRITPEIAARMREIRTNIGTSYKKIGDMFGVSETQATKVCKNQVKGLMVP